MKNINKLFLGSALLCTASLTGCIEETFPESSTATSEQVALSPTVTANLASGMPSSAIGWWDNDSHWAFNYPAEMIIRDMMTGDMYHYGETGYSHFITWARNLYMGDGYLRTQFHWNMYYTRMLLAINQVAGAVNPSNATTSQLGILGQALAFRALVYLDLARQYEFLPNDIFPDGMNDTNQNVLHLTVPIVTDKTTPEQAVNNPRVDRETMKEFILSDLNNAEKYITPTTPTDGTQPTLACVYGLKARLYMWCAGDAVEGVDADGKKLTAAEMSKYCYEQAAIYADKAITASGMQPLTEAQALNTTSGFNTLSSFMWGMQQTQESAVVQSGICNWTSWMSNQTTFGYTGVATGLFSVIDKKLYERISDTDWRKKMWVAPEGSPLRGQTTFPNSADVDDWYKYVEDYICTKFRPGNGNADDPSEGASTAVPFMRVEEMHFIKAEALAQSGDEAGAKSALETIMKTRDAAYTCSVSGDFLIDEIIFQKRIELWGEGQTFFDIKRLNLPVVRGYEGTNCQDTQCRLNTTTRPAWMNFVMVRTESNNNHAIENFNNPDPSNKYTPWAE